MLLLDEPFAGLSVEERRDVLSLIGDIPRDVTIVMIEHDMDVALEFAERITRDAFRRGHRRGHARRGRRQPAHQGDLPWRSDALLLSDIDAYYGDSHVLHRVSLRLGEGRLLGLLGRNGAGKSTCMSVAVGWLPPRRGTVTVYGERGRRPFARGNRGARRRTGAAGPPHVPQPDCARKPHGRRAQAAERAAAPWTSTASSRPFRASASDVTSTPAICPAASSRCWRSHAP